MSPPTPTDRLPTSRRDWAALLDRLGVRPSKGLGQHFLFERGVVQKMVRAAEVGPDDLVLEIGPGLGILTEELLRRARAVVAVELDRRLAAYLAETLAPAPSTSLRACPELAEGAGPRLRIVEGDALSLPIDELIPPGEPFVVVANLPYAVGSAVLRHLLEPARRPRRLTVMLQAEVAERLVAKPPEMSVLGVAAQFYAAPRIAFRVSPSVFLPPPSVESAVAILDVRPEPPLPESEHPRFFRIVNAGFRHKRKQLANSLVDELALPKPIVIAWLDRAAIDPMRRAQTLAVAEWVTLTRAAPADVR
jgi:16S rRNA (adenine1518-N6/adenine1519-N6)-dimethyltransferase